MPLETSYKMSTSNRVLSHGWIGQDLPEPFDWTNDQPDPQPDVTVASVFRQRYTVRVAQLYLWEAWHKAAVQLCEVAKMDEGLPCPAD